MASCYSEEDRAVQEVVLSLPEQPSSPLLLFFDPALYAVLLPEDSTLNRNPSFMSTPITVPAWPSYHVAVLPAGQLIRFRLPGVFFLFFCCGIGRVLWSFHGNLISYAGKG